MLKLLMVFIVEVIMDRRPLHMLSPMVVWRYVGEVQQVVLENCEIGWGGEGEQRETGEQRRRVISHKNNSGE